MTTDNPESRDERLEQVLAEYLRSVERNQPLDQRLLDQQRLLEQHPDLADELKSFFANRAALERVAAPLRHAGDAPTVGLAPSGEENPGDQQNASRVRYFGDYELLEELGRGGMGVVYKARQTTLNRPVALKMILAGRLASPDDVRRFKQEAEAAANLDHPHIAPIYETGEHNGHHYFSMKLIEGRSLRDALPELGHDRQAVRRGVTLFAEVARAVHHAHQRGVLHRDLKPANVLLDADGTAYVTDFGLAKRVDRGAGFQPAVTTEGTDRLEAYPTGGDLTRTGAIVGTPSYMAPEQAAGERQLTTAVDVYSLGAMLYELLTGQPPLRAESPLETLLLAATREPERPRRLNPQADGDLETIALKCLEKDPARRYASADALAVDLENWLAGLPIAARPVSPWERFWRWSKRRPALAATLGLAVLCVTLALIATGVGWQLRETRRQRDLAEAETRRAEEQTKRAEALLYANRVNRSYYEWRDNNVAAAYRGLEECPPEQRGWEWRYVRRLCRSEAKSYPLPTDSKMLLSPDGRLLASLGQQEVLVCESESGRVTAKLPLRDSVGQLAFSPNAKLLAIANATTGAVALWDLAEPRVLHELRHQGAAVGALAFSPDGATLATAPRDGQSVRLWDVATGVERQVIAVNCRAWSNSLAFHPEGRQLAVAGDAGAHLFNPLTGARIRDLTVGGAGNVVWGGETVRYLEGGRLLITTFAHPIGERVWESETEGQIALSPWPERLHLADVIAPNGQCVAGSVSQGIAVRSWSGAEVGAVEYLRTDATRVLGFLSSRELLSAGNGRVAVWDLFNTLSSLRRGQESAAAVAHAAQPVIAFSPDGRFAASSPSEHQKILLWETAKDWTWVTLPKIGTSGADVLAFGPTGTTLMAYHHHERAFHVWDVETGKSLRAARIPKEDQVDDAEIVRLDDETGRPAPVAYHPAAFHPSGKWAALVGSGGNTLVIDLEAGRVHARLPGLEHRVTAVAYSPDGELLATLGPQELVLRAADTGRLLRRLPTDRPSGFQPVSLSFSQDGRLLAAAVAGRVEIWEIDSGRMVQTIANSDSAAAFLLPDGRRLALGNRLIDLFTGADLLRLWAPVIGCSPDGRYLAIRDLNVVHLLDGSPLPE